MKMTKPHWPLFAAVGLLVIIVASQLTLSIRKNGGNFVYALDDTYIHMAIARNFARYGVWGVTRHEFSSSTSSLLWTLLLAGAYLFTSSAFVPLVFNILSALVLLAVANSLLDPLTGFAKLALLSTLVLLTPLPALIFSGMEHTAHILLCLPLVFTAASVIEVDQLSLRRRKFWLLPLLAALAATVRYESLFLVFSVALLLGIRRRLVAAVLVVVAALFPLAVYGLISRHYGSEFLPNPLLLKGSFPRDGILPFLQQALVKILSAPHLLFLLVTGICLLSLRRKGGVWQKSRILFLIFIVATTLHVFFAGVGWFYRYEAYLIAVGLMITGQTVFELMAGRKQRPGARRQQVFPVVATVTLSIITAVVFLLRANTAIRETTPAMKNIYDQQYQMATFLKTYYSGESVAANDIGAINFFADIRCLDLWGLASVKVTRAKLAGGFNTQKIVELVESHQVRIALLYSGWFQGNESVPEGWLEVGQWTIRDCVVCGNPHISFYAVDSNEAQRLKRNLRSFSAQLPGDVIQTGSYLNE